LNKELRESRKFKHGHSVRGKKSKTYQAWMDMKTRCYSKNHPSFPGWGGRGIKICKEWRNSFEQFLVDMGACPGPGYSLDRYPDNNGDYKPANCRWATISEQSNNKRIRSDAVMITWKGKTKALEVWARELGFKRSTLYDRLLVHGWPVKKAFTAPVRNW
jgi:hypothetical protein